MKSRRINKHDLTVSAVMDSANSSSGGLRLIRDNRYFDATNCIYEGRLTCVGSTNKGYKSAAHSYRVVTNIADCAKKNFDHADEPLEIFWSPFHFARPAKL